MKKYKDMRFALIFGVLAALMAVLGMVLLACGDKTRGIIMLVLTCLAMFMISLRYDNMMDETCLILVTWKYVYITARVIEYGQIVKVGRTGKYKITVTYRDPGKGVKTANVYTFKGDDFMRDFQLMSTQWKNRKEIRRMDRKARRAARRAEREERNG